MLEHVRGVMAYNCLSNTIKGTPAIDHPVITSTSSHGTLQAILSFNIRERKDGDTEEFLHSL